MLSPLLFWFILRDRRAAERNTGKLWWVALSCLESIPEALVLAMTAARGEIDIAVATLVFSVNMVNSAAQFLDLLQAVRLRLCRFDTTA